MAALITLIVTINNVQSSLHLSLLFSAASYFDRGTTLYSCRKFQCPFWGFYGFKEVVNLGPERRSTAILYKENIPLTHMSSLPCGRGIRARFGHVSIVNVYAPIGTHSASERSLFYGEDVVPLLRTLLT